MITFSNSQNIEQEECIKNALTYFIENYLKKDVHVVVSWGNSFEKGEAFVLMSEDLSKFEIEIKPTEDKTSILLSLSHEIIHVKQMLDKRLSIPLFQTLPMIRWQDNPDSEPLYVLHKNPNSMSSSAWEDYYSSLPWEKEAHFKMHSLLHEYLDFYNKEKSKSSLRKSFERLVKGLSQKFIQTRTLKTE